MIFDQSLDLENHQERDVYKDQHKVDRLMIGLKKSKTVECLTKINKKKLIFQQ